MAGETYGAGFPTTPGAFDRSANGSLEAFVSKLDADGGLVFSTFLGGSLDDLAYALALDRRGAIYVAGPTGSGNFPTTPDSYQPAYRGGGDMFIAKLNPRGNRLVYSTFLGGSREDLNEYAYRATGLAVNRHGAAYVVGRTTSRDFPVTPGAYQRNNHGGHFGYDGFVSKLNPAGSALEYSSYFGGTEDDCYWSCDIAVGSDGSTYITGSTESADFPTTPGAFRSACPLVGGGCGAVFVMHFDPGGATPLYSTFLGSGFGNAIAVSANGSAVVAGEALASASFDDFPTTPGAYQTACRFNADGYCHDGFATRLSVDGGALAFSTFLGGSDDDAVNAVAVGRDGTVSLLSYTESFDYPTTPGAYDTSCADGFFGCLDSAVARLSADGSHLLYGTFIGGSFNEGGWALALDTRGDAVIAGNTGSTDFPTTPNAFEPTCPGSCSPAFVSVVATSP